MICRQASNITMKDRDVSYLKHPASTQRYHNIVLRLYFGQVGPNQEAPFVLLIYSIIKCSRVNCFIMPGVATMSSCLIHFKGEKGPLTCFTETSFKKVLTSHQQWRLTLDGKLREIADKTARILKNLQNLSYPSDMIKCMHYH